MNKATEYKGFYICHIDDSFFRVKNNPNDSYAVHHGRFKNIEDAKKHIDLRQGNNAKYFSNIKV